MFFLKYCIICVDQNEYDQIQIGQTIIKQDCIFTVYHKDRADNDYNLHIQQGNNINQILK